MKNGKLKLLFLILVLFLHLFLVKTDSTFAIYKQALNAPITLTVLDPSASIAVTLHANDGTNNTTTEYRTYNQILGNVTSPTRTGYNFLGWYDSNGNRAYSGDAITGPIDLYAHWQKIVCKKVTDQNKLHTETCAGSQGCTTSGTGFNKTTNNIITYGTTYGQNSPIAGDAYDCDVNNDGTYDPQDQYGKYTERFYFLKENINNNSENTATLIYYTSFDANGRIDSQHNNNIGSDGYDTALTHLPTSSTWTNPSLIGFSSNNGNITRFITLEEVETVCGAISRPFPNPPTTVVGPQYFNNCQKWFLFENSRFQSSSLGRAGIWMQIDNGQHYRIQTGSVALMSVAATSENTARPVIEIPISAFEGYVNAERYDITFETHGGTLVSGFKRYEGEAIGTIDTTTKEHYNFDGWYASYVNGEYSIPVNSSTIVTGNMTLHAKWAPKPTSTVTFNANGGTIDGESTFDVIVDTGDTIDSNDIPTAVYQDHSFDGWYTDSGLTEPFDETEPITDDITIFAAWAHATYVASVNGTPYETLAEAIDAVPVGTQSATTVTLLRNVTLSETVTIPSDKWVELVGGNRTISGSTDLIINEGKLNIVSGTITTPSLTTATQLIRNRSGATLNISGGTLTNPSSNGTNEFLVIENIGGTVNITGGTLNSYGQSAGINNKSNGILNISGGEIIAHNVTKGQAVYSESGTVTISGNAYLENVSGTGDTRAAVDNNGGTLIITGGTIVSKGWSAVIARKGGATTRIGTDDDVIDISTPVLRGQRYGLERTAATAVVQVYDGIFEAYSQTQAISTTSVTKPDGIDFKTDGTVSVEGVSYHAAYLLAPSITINFYEESGGTAIPVTVDNGTEIGSDLPTPSPKQGYYFAGWFIDGDLLQPVTSATVVTGPFTAYARWVQSVSNATMDTAMTIQINTTDTIEFEENDIESVTYSSSDTSVATVDSDGTVHAVNVGTATITITGELSGDTRTVTVTVTQIMNTVKFYDADYNPNDLEHSTLIDTVQVVSGSSIAANDMPTPTNSNYVFNTWYINGDTSTPFTTSTMVTGDINVVATWKEKVSYATVTTSPTPFKVIVGNTGQITLSPTIQGDEVEDCTFTSANTNYATVNSSGQVTGVAIGDTYITVTGSLSGATIQVPVSADVLKYTVRFKDGNTVIKTVEVESGETVDTEMPANQTKTNYIFNGWVYDNNNTLTPFTSATEVYGDLDVLVSWKETLTIATLPDDPISLLVGSNKQVVVTATGDSGLVEDYTLSSSNTNYVEVTGKTIIGVDVGSITLTLTGIESGATRTITVNVVNSYTVTFDPVNGNQETEIQVPVGSSIDDSDVILPSDPTKTNYVFDRWYLYDEANETLTSTPLDTSATVTGDMIYKAKWVSNTYVAAVYVAGQDASYYTTLQAAFNAVPTSGVATEVKLLQNIVNPSGQSKVSSGRSVILNGGNYSVTCGNSTTKQLIMNEGGTLRIISGTYSCGKSTLATLENSAGRNLYIDGGLIENTNDRAAIYNVGNVFISGGELTSVASERAVVQNASGSASTTMSGGIVKQLANSNMGAIYNKASTNSITITGGTIISQSTTSSAIENNGGPLTIGTNNGTYDVTNPVIQGDKYGINSTVSYSIYDGIIKGKTNNQAVNDFNKITGTETGSARQTGTDGDYYTLYYTLEQPAKYRINFNAGEGTVSPSYIDFDLNEAITTSDLPTPTNGIANFDGWYDSTLTTPFTTITPDTAGEMTLYAKWTTYVSSLTPVTHNILSDALSTYFSNVSSYVAADSAIAVNQDNDISNDNHSAFTSSLNTIFTNNNCSACNGANTCTSPGAGTRCDYQKEFDTGLSDNLVVYSYDNGVKGSVVTYVTSSGGVIYNMIPGKTYYWESATDNTKYGVVTATGARRTLKTDVRNLRDLGGLAVSYTDLVTGNTVNGTIDYGRLYRGAQLITSQGITDLTKLGINREIDLRSDSDNPSQYRLDDFDIGTKQSHTDIVVTNYHIHPEPTDYLPLESAEPSLNNGNSCGKTHLTEYRLLKAAIKQIMTYVVGNGVDPGDNIFFHCTIGTDRTGTIAYFLEGLLGVSEEDRLRDYELSYFFGLTNRSRFHDYLSGSSINPRFYSMYKSYPTNADIYAWYTYERAADDDTLLTAFRNAIIH